MTALIAAHRVMVYHLQRHVNSVIGCLMEGQVMSLDLHSLSVLLATGNLMEIFMEQFSVPFMVSCWLDHSY